MTTPETLPTAHSASDVQRAVAYLDAVSLPDGHFAWWDDASRRDWSVTSSEMAELGIYLADGEGDAYSRWCATISATEMPRGWEPESAE